MKSRLLASEQAEAQKPSRLPAPEGISFRNTVSPGGLEQGACLRGRSDLRAWGAREPALGLAFVMENLRCSREPSPGGCRGKWGWPW